MHRRGERKPDVVVPVGAEATRPEPSDAPTPLDPMAGPGIASADLHPAPLLSPSAVDAGMGLTNTPAAGGLAPPPRLGLGLSGPSSPSAPAVASPAARPGRGAGARPGRSDTGPALRLVVSRPMWDGGVMVQRSPSLAALHPPLAIRVNPGDLSHLGDGQVGEVRVSTPRGSVVVPVVPDARVTPGSAVLPFNLPGGGAGSLINASAAYTELTLEQVSAP